MKWIFEGRVYSSLEELKGRTMSEGNKPEPVFTLEEFQKCWFVCKSIYVDKDQNGFFIDKKFHNHLYGEYGIDTYYKKVDVGEGAESESEL